MNNKTYIQQNCPRCGLISSIDLEKPDCSHCKTEMKIQIINEMGEIIYEYQ